MEETSGVADVALAAGIGADEHGERADAQGLVGEVLEVDEPERPDHGWFRLRAPALPERACVTWTIRSDR